MDNNTNQKKLGALIRRLRIQRGFTNLRKFAQSIGKSAPFLCRIESGYSSPGIETVLRLIEKLGHRDEILSIYVKKLDKVLTDFLRKE